MAYTKAQIRQRASVLASEAAKTLRQAIAEGNCGCGETSWHCSCTKLEQRLRTRSRELKRDADMLFQCAALMSE